jgi:hypothetical protein
MGSEWLEKMRSVGVLRGGRTRDRVQSGRDHPETGKPWLAVTDELGNTVTEHSEPGSGVAFRQDVEICPGTVRARTELGPL